MGILRSIFGGLFKGWYGEQKAALNMWLFLDGQVYTKFHDVILPSPNGTAQIDHILVSAYGVFIVETKNKGGWIFGSEDQATWTQVVYGRKYPFQNPLRQAYRQKKVLAQFIQLDESCIHPIIFFVGDCKFKTELPPNVLRYGLGEYLSGFREQALSQEKVDEITKRLEIHTHESTLSTTDHLRSLRERHGSTTVCPRCGGDLVSRTARNGRNAGTVFLGCSNYPRCRFTKNS